MVFLRSRRPLLRLAVLALAASVALPLASCRKGPEGGKPLRRAKQRVFVIGFDGMDPTLSRKYMDEGKLPNLKALAEEGVFAKLGSTQPSESPTAWSSFATGVNPGKHSIYDFLIRDLATYFPDFNMIKKEPPEFLWGLIPTKPPKITSMRGGTSFWKTASADGIKSVVLTVPVTFPTEELHHGQMLGGLPLPDLRGTLGTFYYWATDLSSYEEGNTEFGGFLKRLLLDGGVSETVLKGPENPILKQEEAQLREKKKAGSLSEREQARLDELATGKDINLPMTRALDRGRGPGRDRDPGPEAQPEAGRVERLGAAQLPHQRARARARDDAVRAPRRRPRAAPLRLAGEHGPAQPAAADLVSGVVLEGARRPDRPLPHARLGRVGRQAAQRGPARRGAVPVRLRPRDGRPREDHPEAARDRRLGPVRGRDRDHRPHLAHDVAPDRPEAPDVRRGARRRSTATRSRRSTGAPTTSSAGCARRCRRTPCSWSCPTTASTRSAAR